MAKTRLAKKNCSIRVCAGVRFTVRLKVQHEREGNLCHHFLS